MKWNIYIYSQVPIQVQNHTTLLKVKSSKCVIKMAYTKYFMNFESWCFRWKSCRKSSIALADELRNNLSLSQFEVFWSIAICRNLKTLRSCRLPSITRAAGGSHLNVNILAKINCLSQDTQKNPKSATGKRISKY